jgi:hypothetical protein
MPLTIYDKDKVDDLLADKLPKKTVNTITGYTYTLASGDLDNTIYIGNSGGGLTITIPDDSSLTAAAGTEVRIVVDNTSAYQVQPDSAPMTPATLNGSGSGYTITRNVVTLVKAAANTWYIA